MDNCLVERLNRPIHTCTYSRHTVRCVDGGTVIDLQHDLASWRGKLSYSMFLPFGVESCLLSVYTAGARFFTDILLTDTVS